MKSPESRKDVITNIERFLITTNPRKMKDLEEEISHDNKISMVKFFKIVNNRIKIEELNDAEIYWIISAISKVTNKFGKPEDYFEDREILNHKYYNPATKEKKYTNGVTFKNVCKLAENQYMFPLSVREIRDLKNANILQIIPELQRNHTKDKYGDLKTKVNKQTAQTISSLINNGEFFYNGVRINLMDDGEADPPIFDEENGTLTVSNGTMIVPDGNHRTIACELASKHLDDKFGVFFTYLSESRTRELLNQEWTTVPIPKRHKDAMKRTISNKIVDSIIRSEDADELYTKNIVKDGSEIKNGNGFILYIELSDAISRYYNADKIQVKADQDDLKNWLITYMNYLTKIMYDDFSKFASTKRTKWSTHFMAWHYYIMISKNIEGNPRWKEILKEVIENTDFTDKEIKNYCVTNNRRKLYEFCESKEVELCSIMSRS